MLSAGFAAALTLGNLTLSFNARNAQAATAPPPVAVGVSALDPAAEALYLKARGAESQLSYRGRLNTTYWRTGHTTSVILRHMAPNSLRIDYVEPDSIRGRAVVVIAGNEWTYSPSDRSLTHRTFASHSLAATAGLDLLTRNYILKVLPQPDTVIQRKTTILEVLRRANHTVARKFWIDDVTGLILKREMVSEDGKLTVTISYSDISFHPQLTAANFDLSNVTKIKGVRQVDETKTNKSTVPVSQVTQPLPGSIYPPSAAGYRLVGSGSRQINSRLTEEVHYSDGLELLSLFEQKRIKVTRATRVPRVMTPVPINGKTAHFSRRNSLETIIWDNGPLRLMVVGEANQDRMLAFAIAVDQFVSKSTTK